MSRVCKNCLLVVNPKCHNTLEGLWNKVDQSSGPDACWPYMGHKIPKGYGHFKVFGKTWITHRLAYYLKNNGIPEGMWILHKCDNPPCCNPSHLFAGTNQDNVTDKMTKGRWGGGVGMRSNTAKLRDTDVLAIRRIYSEQFIINRKLGDYFGVHESTIEKVVSGRQWKHLPVFKRISL